VVTCRSSESLAKSFRKALCSDQPRTLSCEAHSFIITGSTYMLAIRHQPDLDQYIVGTSLDGEAKDITKSGAIENEARLLSHIV
jgi:hypothetical protein